MSDVSSDYSATPSNGSSRRVPKKPRGLGGARTPKRMTSKSRSAKGSPSRSAKKDIRGGSEKMPAKSKLTPWHETLRQTFDEEGSPWAKQKKAKKNKTLSEKKQAALLAKVMAERRRGKSKSSSAASRSESVASESSMESDEEDEDPKILVLYSSVEGQTAKIANAIAEVIKEKEIEVDVVELSATKYAEWINQGHSMRDYSGVIVGSSVHGGSHSALLRNALQPHVSFLHIVPSAFFQVSLATAFSGPKGKRKSRKYMGVFLDKLGWSPLLTEKFGGALCYRKYGFVKRQIMRLLVARLSDNDSDESYSTNRNHDFTDQEAVKKFAEEFCKVL